MTFNPVIICDTDYAVRHLSDLSLKAGFKLAKARLALVKPNLCGLYHPSSSIILSSIEFLLSGVESAVIGETKSQGHDPEEQFERLGVNSLLKHLNRNVKAVDLSNDERVKVSVSNPHALSEIEIPKIILYSDVLLNIPKVGTHYATRLTCALKNLFGLLPQKNKYSLYHHLGMDAVIADIAQVIKPDLNVVDAEDKVILGVDALSVDVVACRFANLNPLKVEHLRLVSDDRKEKLEDLLKKIKIIEV
jgi:uncharacterized protein (DUF362 family)